jgi:cytochrome b6-f complex iron-sulfur subunit
VVTNGRVVLTIDSNSPIATVGGAALVQTSVGSVLVARTSQDAFVALTATCTHEGCTVTGYENQVYTCPCHGSQYSTSGQVLRGPAPRALSQFATSFANGTLTITL